MVLSTSWMIALVVFFARWLIILNIVLALFFLGSHLERRHAVAAAAWSAILALILTSLIAFFVQRVRPFLGHADIHLLIPPPFNTSFPSGHTATSIALALSFLRVSRTAGFVSLVIAGFVMFGRLAVGVHFPTDILGGICVGALSCVIVDRIHRQLESSDMSRAAKHHHHV